MPTDDNGKESDNQQPIDDDTKINNNTNVIDDVAPPTSNNNDTNKEKNDDGTLKDENSDNNNNTNKKRSATSCDNSSNNTNENNNNNNENKKARKTTNSSNNDDDATVVVDMADQLGYKAGDRLEVKWELSDDKEEEEVDGTTTTTTRSHWWGCTLLEYDGRTSEDGAVAIRVLHYDAYPEGGFPDSSKEDVYFITPSILLNNTGEELMYRREGEEATLSLDEQDLRDKLNGMLMNILQKHSESWDKLDASKKAHMAELMSKGKESIIRTIQEKWEKEKKVILAADIPEILQDAFQSLNQPQQE